MNNNPDPLDPIGALAEHLDSVGEHQAAFVVRDVQSSLRSCCEPIPDAASLVQFTAGLVADSTAQLEQLREVASKRITAEQCWTAASAGGAAVAELVDHALGLAASLTGP